MAFAAQAVVGLDLHVVEGDDADGQRRDEALGLHLHEAAVDAILRGVHAPADPPSAASDESLYLMLTSERARSTLTSVRTVIVDDDLVKSEWVNFHPLNNAASTTLRAADLMKFIRALGYAPLVVNCGEGAA